MCAATAKSLQLCPILCDPIDGSPPGSPIPGILQARTLEWVAISFSNKCVYIHVNISLLSYMRGTKSTEIFIAMSMPSSRPWFLIPFLIPAYKNKQDSSEKWLILEVGQEIYEMNLEHVVVPESKKVLKTNKQTKRSTMVRNISHK